MEAPLSDEIVNKKLENVNNNFEEKIHMEKLKQELIKSFTDYRSVIKMLVGDAPISVLCLNKKIEKSLSAAGFFRVYDIFDLDFTEIKGLTDVDITHLTSRLDEFVSML